MESIKIVNTEGRTVSSAVSLMSAYDYFSLKQKGQWVKPISAV